MPNNDNLVTPSGSEILTPESIQVVVNPNAQSDPVITDLQRNLIELSQPFNNELGQIRTLVDETKSLLKLNDEKFDLTNLDENELADALEKLNGTRQLYSQVTDTKKKIKQHLNEYVSAFILKIDSVLDEAGFNDLDLLKTEATRIRREMLDLRRQSAWMACYSEYVDALTPYPIIEQVFPNLVKFDAFERIVNQRSLFKPSGAKTFKVTAAIKNSITDLVVNLNNLANTTITELTKLPQDTHATIIMTVTSNPTTETLYKQVQYTLQTLEAKRIREEQLKKAREEQALLANAQQTHQNLQDISGKNDIASQQISGTTHIPTKLPIQDNGVFYNNSGLWLQQQYIPAHVNSFYDVSTNDSTKLAVIQTLVADLQNPSSELSAIINGNSSAALTILLAAMNL